MPSVFWSWQSDAPARETRQIIKEALDLAVHEINNSVDAAERPEAGFSIDHDTKGLSGSPDIVAAILRKIELASAFVADVTPIGVLPFEKGPKHVQNPNVLIELGYAKKALGLERVIQVWNTAITGCNVDDLPFDMKGRRGPISFELPVNASKEEYRNVRKTLARDLSKALVAITPKELGPEAWPAWRKANSSNPSIWFEEGERLVVNEPSYGAGHKVFPKGPTRYVRLLPRHWDRPISFEHSSLLGHVSGISWGRTTGGHLTYQGSIIRPELADSPNGTMLFPDTGEVWAIDRFIVSKWENKLMLHGDDMFKGIAAFIPRQTSRMVGHGAKFPMKVKIGVTGLLGSHWPRTNPFDGQPQAVEEMVEVEGILNSTAREEIEPLLVGFWTNVRDAYGMSPPDKGRIDSALRGLEN